MNRLVELLRPVVDVVRRLCAWLDARPRLRQRILELARRGDEQLVTFSDDRQLLHAAAPGPVTASPAERTISGLIVPFGKPGHTSGGLLTFGPGSLRWGDPKRVKLLVEHDQRESVGYATELRETPEGVMGTFHVPEGPEGDRALSQAANGVRDGFSVGVMLDAATTTNLRRNAAQGKPTKGSGELRENSLVSVPAFIDAAVQNVAASTGQNSLVVSAWADSIEKGNSMECSTCGLVHPNGVTSCEQARAQVTASGGQGTTTANGSTTTDQGANATAGANQTGPGSSSGQGGQQATAGAAGDRGSANGPAVVTAAAGNAFVTDEASVYTFSGSGESLVRDAWRARMEGDNEAADRVRRFNTQLTEGNTSSVQALMTAAVETTSGDAAAVVPTLHRPDLMRAMIDRARPVISRVTSIPISDATPFNIPDVGDFDGVADHTEGTAHAAEGDLAITGTPVQPRAMSGAYRISRELVDASNPALDRIAVRKMVKDYRGKSEAKMVAALLAGGVDALNVTTIALLRTQLLTFINDDDEGADFVALSPDLLNTLADDVDGTGRPMLPAVGPMNAAGTWKPGGTGSTVENAELVRASKVTAAQGAIVRSEGALWFESPTQTFSFSEVEGPGVLKLALWGYTAAAVPDAEDVLVISSASV